MNNLGWSRMSSRLLEEPTAKYTSRRSTSSLTNTSQKAHVVNVIVIEVGERLTRIGFAGEFCPREIFKTEYVDSLRPSITHKLIDKNRDPESQNKIIGNFFKDITLRRLMKSANGLNVVIVDNLLSSYEFRDACGRALFENPSLGAAGVCYVPSPLMQLVSYNVKTALVVDLGIKEALVTPVYERVVMGVNSKVTTLSTLVAEKKVRGLMRKMGRVRNIDGDLRELSEEDMIVFDKKGLAEDILFRFCFATKRERGLKIQEKGLDPDCEIDPPPPDVKIPYGSEYMVIPGLIREAAAEVLFITTEDGLSLQDTIIECIRGLNIDLKRPMLNGILVVGGLSMMKVLIENDEKLRTIGEVGFYRETDQPSLNFYSAWLGASLFGSLDAISSRLITRNEWNKTKHIPDWTDLTENDEITIEDDCKVSEITVDLPWESLKV
ncbi:unnamed protein product [Bursaphelenchus xylophilus]|uniref:(pine wood nematode) hypothetical protein n=1 Tax=Bursaphelenchus xylophilus TaxID=6326 RepID=A0A7I8WTZ8_BURXY|nr:unnamed protein product [Bursaphelenchus xylophilus]CAG9116228.1 unnamed protein product [Bursaphelenchus xylophilus]